MTFNLGHSRCDFRHWRMLPSLRNPSNIWFNLARETGGVEPGNSILQVGKLRLCEARRLAQDHEATEFQSPCLQLWPHPSWHIAQPQSQDPWSAEGRGLSPLGSLESPCLRTDLAPKTQISPQLSSFPALLTGSALPSLSEVA